MTSADRFIRDLKKIASAHYADPLDTTIPLVQQAFEYSLRHVPDSISEELFLQFLQRFSAGNFKDAELPREAESLAPFVDLFSMEYDDRNDPLQADDWVLVRDLSNQCAGDMDLDLVTYIMTRVLDHKKI